MSLQEKQDSPKLKTDLLMSEYEYIQKFCQQVLEPIRDMVRTDKNGNTIHRIQQYTFVLSEALNK